MEAYRHALANLDRLREATASFRELQTQEDAAAEAAGLPPSWQKRARAVHDDPNTSERTLAPEAAFLGVKGARLSVARAIAKGIDPGTLDLLRERYGIVITQEDGIGLRREVVLKARAYNATMQAEMRRRFGTDVFKRNQQDTR